MAELLAWEGRSLWLSDDRIPALGHDGHRGGLLARLAARWAAPIDRVFVRISEARREGPGSLPVATYRSGRGARDTVEKDP